MQLDDFEESDGVTSEGKDIFLFILEKNLTFFKNGVFKKVSFCCGTH